jgi:SAM-dependent methyltransferase
VGVDPSEPELKLARDLVADKRVEFVNGTAQNLRRVVNHADAVLMSNVLHQIPFVERSEVFHSVSEVLKPGGIFAFTTLYYEGTLVTETRSFYALWMLKTFGELRRRGMQAGQNHPRGPAFEQLTPAQHRELLVLAGFDEVSIEEPVFQWSLDDWKALSRYSVFIKNTLGDIDLLAGSNALQWGVAAAYEELGINRIARRWLHGVARRAPAKAIRRGVFEEGRDKNPHTEPAGR